LAQREFTRFIRQPHRVIGALGTPIVFWLLIGAGVGTSFSGAGGVGGQYITYFFPGTVLMILLFTAIFSTISVIEDRREGFLQGVLVSPVSRGSIVWGKVLGGGGLAIGQAVLFVLLAPFIGLTAHPLWLGVAMLFLVVLAIGLTALGFCIAWRLSSTQGFHAIMNLFLMPMWFLSGALFPPGGSWTGLRWVILANPLSYGLAGLRIALHGGDASAAAGFPHWGVCLLITSICAAAMVLLARIVAARNGSTEI
jgi:ABC-2 type transport system permease protein